MSHETTDQARHRRGPAAGRHPMRSVRTPRRIAVDSADLEGSFADGDADDAVSRTDSGRTMVPPAFLGARGEIPEVTMTQALGGGAHRGIDTLAVDVSRGTDGSANEGR